MLIVLLLVAAGVTAFAAGEYVTTRQAGYQNILFSNGYRGFCIDYHKDSARNGEGFIVAENTSIADNNLTHEDISGLLKAMFVHCFDTVFVKSGNTYVIRNAETVQFAIWKLTDDLNFNDQQAYALVDAVKAYDGPEIPDHGYTLYLENGDEVIFDFIVVTPKNSNTQNFFAYKLTVVRHEHDYGDWENDETSHWKECSCGDITEEGKHAGGEANCHEQAECEICGASYGQADKTNHDGETEVRGAKPATTEEEGYTGDTYCLGCDEMIEKGEVIPKLHHHDYGDWENDETSHWKECSCGDITEEGKHAGGEANCHEQAECETCGASYGQADKTNHDGETEVRGAKPATENES
ncbi:MAG: hypothetical protein J6L88_02120, partial [Clostridia bacterium]|nr:hypothetical protein [Clostridia bacterium]